MTALNLIKDTRVRNPLLVLITDGVPNTPLWTLDAKADGLEAAGRIANSNVRFICIGVESNRYYLEKVADRAQGVLYLVDDLNKENLINIVKAEKRTMLEAKRSLA
jgi:magnesium chelatase subunit D